MRCLFLLRTKKSFQILQDSSVRLSVGNPPPEVPYGKNISFILSALWFSEKTIMLSLTSFLFLAKYRKRQRLRCLFLLNHLKTYPSGSRLCRCHFLHTENSHRCFSFYQQNINLKSGIISGNGVRPKNSPYSVARPKTYQGVYHDNKKY